MFLNAMMLIGAAAAVTPLVLHLLSRARFQNVDWGAMMFLAGRDNQQRQSARFTQILLLLMRSALIALLAMALARPVIQGKWAGQESEGRVTAALILDCSPSMAFDENGRTRFQMAQTTARQILRGLRPEDRVALILMGGPRGAAEVEPTGDLRAVEARIDEAKIGYGRANFRDALELAADVLGRNEKSSRDVYVVCDRRARGWQSIDAHFAAEWKRRMHGPGLNTRMFVLPVGSADSDNIAIDSVRLVNPPAIVSQPTDVEVVVHNYGSVQHAAVPITIEGAGPNVPERTVNLGKGQTVAVTFNVAFSQTGSQVLTAKLKSAGYALDDQMDAAVNVIAPIRVLVISGDERSGQFRGEGDFLKTALAPHRWSGVSGADPCSVVIVPAESWTQADLARYQVVVLANVERFTPQQARSLEKYVYHGGRLLFAPGSLSRVDNYNEQLYRDGAGLLPAMLQPPTAADGSDATTILSVQSDHPIFQFLRGRADIPSATITRYFPAIPRQVDADVLARYLSNDPFIIEGQRGRVLLETTSLDADWNALPLSNFYLPFIQSAIRYLAAGAVDSGNLQPGHPIQLTFEDGPPPLGASVTRPDGRTIKLDIVRLEKQAEIRYGDTEQPGVYRVAVQEASRAAQASYFIVHSPSEDSDLTQLDDEKWQWLESSLGFMRIDPTAKPVMETLGAHREGRELWGALLAAVMALFLAEMFVSRLGSVKKNAQEGAEAPPAKAEQESEVAV